MNLSLRPWWWLWGWWWWWHCWCWPGRAARSARMEMTSHGASRDKDSCFEIVNIRKLNRYCRSDPESNCCDTVALEWVKRREKNWQKEKGGRLMLSWPSKRWGGRRRGWAWQSGGWWPCPGCAGSLEAPLCFAWKILEFFANFSQGFSIKAPKPLKIFLLLTSTVNWKPVLMA